MNPEMSAEWPNERVLMTKELNSGTKKEEWTNTQTNDTSLPFSGS